MNNYSRGGIWQQALAIRGSVSPYIIRYVLEFGLYAALVQRLSGYFSQQYHFDLGVEISPFEVAGAVLGLLLVFRTNSSYDRWWEARKMWGGIVNQCRNLAITGLSYGPRDAGWRSEFVTWIAVFPHSCRASLRSEPAGERIEALLGPERTAQLEASDHMPNYVAAKLGQLLQQAQDDYGMDRFSFMQADTQRAQLIDHIGGCERILKTPLPLVYVITMRRCIILYLLVLPLALLHKLQSDWLIPLVTMAVTYLTISLDQIGVELQNPFARAHLSHLPLNDISDTITRNVRALLDQSDPS